MSSCYYQQIIFKVVFEQYHVNKMLCVDEKVLYYIFIRGAVWIALHMLLFFFKYLIVTFSWSRKSLRF